MPYRNLTHNRVKNGNNGPIRKTLRAGGGD